MKVTSADKLFFDLLTTDESLVLASVFGHAANLRCARRLYSIVARDAYDAPATACVANAQMFGRLSGLAGTAVAREGGALVFANGDRLECAGAPSTDARLVTLRWDDDRWKRSLYSYRQSILSMGPCPSVLARRVAGLHVLPELRREDGELVKRCERLVSAVGGTSAIPTTCLDDAVRDVLGAGAGLTPAGDDFLCGMLCLLLSIDDSVSQSKAMAIAMSLNEEVLFGRTTAVSASMLWHAARGRAAAPHRGFLRALIEEPELVPGCVRELRGIGSSSGLDFSAGAVQAALLYRQMEESMAFNYMIA